MAADEPNEPARAEPNAALALRFACAADMPAICRIVDHYIATTSFNFRTAPQHPDEWLAEWTRLHARYPWLVAADGDEVVGFAYATPWKAREAYAFSVEVTTYVAHDAARRGIGRVLYSRLLPMLDAQGYRTEIAVIGLPNPASVGFHEAFGFRHAGTLREVGWKRGEWHDVGLWQRCVEARGCEPTAIRAVPASVG